jgi:hypothetical protein
MSFVMPAFRIMASGTVDNAQAVTALFGPATSRWTYGCGLIHFDLRDGALQRDRVRHIELAEHRVMRRR